MTNFTNCTRINTDGNFIISPEGMRIIARMLSGYAATLDEYSNDHSDEAADRMRKEARTADELADAIRGNKFPATKFRMQERWTERPTSGTMFTKRFAGCDEFIVTQHGTGVHVIGQAGGKHVAQCMSDSPEIVAEAMRMAWHEDWASVNESISEDRRQYYARGGKNWAGD
jgi:hypothetical protein